MEKSIAFDIDDNEGFFYQTSTYHLVLDYAFERADFFMLVYVNVCKKGYTEERKYFRDALRKFKVKSRSNPVWPGNSFEHEVDTEFRIAFYKTTEAAKNILKEIESFFQLGDRVPMDLAFFKGDQCWMYTVSHEDLVVVAHAEEEDIDFFLSNGVPEYCIKPYDHVFDKFDEAGLSKKAKLNKDVL